MTPSTTASKALPLKGQGGEGVCGAEVTRNHAGFEHPSPTPPLRGGANCARFVGNRDCPA